MKDNTERRMQHEPSDSYVIRGLSRHKYWVVQITALCVVALVFFTLGSFVAFGSHH